MNDGSFYDASCFRSGANGVPQTNESALSEYLAELSKQLRERGFGVEKPFTPGPRCKTYVTIYSRLGVGTAVVYASDEVMSGNILYSRISRDELGYTGDRQHSEIQFQWRTWKAEQPNDLATRIATELNAIDKAGVIREKVS